MRFLRRENTHLKHTRFFCGFHDRSEDGSCVSFPLYGVSTSDDVKLIGEERTGSYNNTSADAPRCIESTAQDRNEIADSNTFAVEDFREHDDNDLGKRSTLSKYYEGASTFSYYSYSIYSGWIDSSS